MADMQKLMREELEKVRKEVKAIRERTRVQVLVAGRPVYDATVPAGYILDLRFTIEGTFRKKP